MPNGDTLFARISPSIRMQSIKFLDAQTGSHSGVWKDIRGFRNMSFQCDALETGATALIHVSNAATEPVSGSAGPSVAFTMTPTVLTAILDAPYRWAKVEKKAGGTPAVSTCITEATN